MKLKPTLQTQNISSENFIRHTLNNSLSTIKILEKELEVKGYHFEKGIQLQNYSFDFFDPVHKIALCIDNYAHEFSEIYRMDVPKKVHIQSLGITIFRFTDYQILTDIEEIFRALKNIHIQTSTSPAYDV